MALEGAGIDRVVLWGGALLQAPHRGHRPCSAASRPKASTCRSSASARPPAGRGSSRGRRNRRRRRPPDHGPRPVPGSRLRPRGPRIGADQHGHLEQRLRGHHDEAGQPLLAQLRNCSAKATPGNAGTWTEIPLWTGRARHDESPRLDDCHPAPPGHGPMGAVEGPGQDRLRWPARYGTRIENSYPAARPGWTRGRWPGRWRRARNAAAGARR